MIRQLPFNACFIEVRSLKIDGETGEIRACLTLAPILCMTRLPYCCILNNLRIPTVHPFGYLNSLASKSLIRARKILNTYSTGFRRNSPSLIPIISGAELISKYAVDIGSKSEAGSHLLPV